MFPPISSYNDLFPDEPTVYVHVSPGDILVDPHNIGGVNEHVLILKNEHEFLYCYSLTENEYINISGSYIYSHWLLLEDFEELAKCQTLSITKPMIRALNDRREKTIIPVGQKKEEGEGCPTN